MRMKVKMMKRMRGSKLARICSLPSTLALTLAAPVALAVEGIEVPGGVEEAPVSECPQLTRLKYPFLSCVTDEAGRIVLAQRGTGFAAMVKNQAEFVTGEGHWDKAR